MRELIALKEFCKMQGVPEDKIAKMDKKELMDFMIKEELLFICGGE